MPQPMWAEGDPVAMARDFFSMDASEHARGSLGKKHFMQLVAAIAAASMHGILTGPCILVSQRQAMRCRM